MTASILLNGAYGMPGLALMPLQSPNAAHPPNGGICSSIVIQRRHLAAGRSKLAAAGCKSKLAAPGSIYPDAGLGPVLQLV
jgi:hypothetical protein